jgi:hypothetical protein
MKQAQHAHTPYLQDMCDAVEVQHILAALAARGAEVQLRPHEAHIGRRHAALEMGQAARLHAGQAAGRVVVVTREQAGVVHGGWAGTTGWLQLPVPPVTMRRRHAKAPQGWLAAAWTAGLLTASASSMAMMLLWA